MLQNNHNITDEILIAEAVAGNKKSLEVLVKRYQDYIYNISLRMFVSPDDALDATQEVLIKVVTHLKTFSGKSKFKTWLYRIVVNHFLSSPVSAIEQVFARGINLESESLIIESEKLYTEQEIEEVRIACSTGMLLCLNRNQRLIYIIGEVFNADHKMGAELFDTTPGNFRVLLHRAKTDLLNYVSGRCGLVDPKNSCRCNKKAKAMMESGYIDRNNLIFTKDFTQKINQIVEKKKDDVCDEIGLRMAHLFRDSPFQVKSELDKVFTEILK